MRLGSDCDRDNGISQNFSQQGNKDVMHMVGKHW